MAARSIASLSLSQKNRNYHRRVLNAYLGTTS